MVSTLHRNKLLFGPETRADSPLRQPDTLYVDTLTPIAFHVPGLGSDSKIFNHETGPISACSSLPHQQYGATPRPDRVLSTMAEPPAKRARRVDSAVMWDSNDNQARTSDPESARDRRASPSRDDRRDGRYRSRSRERNDRRRERSWSRDRRDRGRRDGDRDGRVAQDRKRSMSRERDYDRRGRQSTW